MSAGKPASLKEHLKTLRQMLSLPTAPFHEEAVAAFVHQWASHRGVDFARDGGGNVVLRYRRPPVRRKGPTWVFAAHMDHPGFVVRSVGQRRVKADFIGNVGKEHFRSAKVRFARAGGGQTVATVRSVRATDDRSIAACTLSTRSTAGLVPGTVGMWDGPGAKIARGRARATPCDDLAGCAAALCALDEICSGGQEADVMVLLTRGEEAGFVGAMYACQNATIPANGLVVAIEASRQQAGAELGDGVVIRVGDRTRTFDPSLMGHLAATAAKLAACDRKFKFVRQLMPGGTCEATAYAMWGLAAGGLCLPLANYHNQGAGGRIEPEEIDLNDFSSMVKLLAALPESGRPADTDAGLRKRLRDSFRSKVKML